MLKSYYIILGSISDKKFVFNLFMSVNLSALFAFATYQYIVKDQIKISPIAAVSINPYHKVDSREYSSQYLDFPYLMIKNSTKDFSKYKDGKFIIYETALDVACLIPSSWYEPGNSILIANYKGKKIIGTSNIIDSCKNIDSVKGENINLASDSPLNEKSKVVVLTMDRLLNK